MSSGTAIINLKKTWEKILLAARVIAAIENPADVCVLSNRTFGQVSSQKLQLQNEISFEIYIWL